MGSAVLNALRDVGFALSEESADEADDEDGSRGPPPGSCLAAPRLGPQATLLELESSDQDSCGRIGFLCAYDGADGIFYACPKEHEGGSPDAAGSRVVKGAVSALIDVAEACEANKIALGLGTEHANCAGFIRALLYLGFSVAPCRRKSVFADCALLLEFAIAWPQRDEVSDDDGLSEASTEYDERDEEVLTEPSLE